ncbi:structural maintenance of chromosomes protein 2-like [Pomacea canaliculata]|uniref:structural maintenance of chromosomes protein 2-like n=1 Tax=Pomacea canaliculata TaxID=400727 RepID=UPI000D72703D|nr:structural maintenance of chromosomes protein 2-like [Pomacea canaliculata]
MSGSSLNSPIRHMTLKPMIQRRKSVAFKKLTETKEKLAKSVNMSAMNLLGSAKEQYADLMKKGKIVLNDKAKIAAVIDELDKKKNEALKKAWEQV